MLGTLLAVVVAIIIAATITWVVNTQLPALPPPIKTLIVVCAWGVVIIVLFIILFSLLGYPMGSLHLGGCV